MISHPRFPEVLARRRGGGVRGSGSAPRRGGQGRLFSEEGKSWGARPGGCPPRGVPEEPSPPARAPSGTYRARVLASRAHGLRPPPALEGAAGPCGGPSPARPRGGPRGEAGEAPRGAVGRGPVPVRRRAGRGRGRLGAGSSRGRALGAGPAGAVSRRRLRELREGTTGVLGERLRQGEFGSENPGGREVGVRGCTTCSERRKPRGAQEGCFGSCGYTFSWLYLRT